MGDLGSEGGWNDRRKNKPAENPAEGMSSEDQHDSWNTPEPESSKNDTWEDDQDTQNDDQDAPPPTTAGQQYGFGLQQGQPKYGVGLSTVGVGNSDTMNTAAGFQGVHDISRAYSRAGGAGRKALELQISQDHENEPDPESDFEYQEEPEEPDQEGAEGGAPTPITDDDGDGDVLDPHETPPGPDLDPRPNGRYEPAEPAPTPKVTLEPPKDFPRSATARGQLPPFKDLLSTPLTVPNRAKDRNPIDFGDL